MKDLFYVVTVENKHGSKNDLQEIDSLALSSFGCEGIEEYSLEEETVDEILGERAFSGGIVTDDVFNDVENYQKYSKTRKYFFYDKQAEKFLNCINETYEELRAELIEEKAEDWNALWRASFKPIEVSNNLRVVPEWMDKDYKGPENIYIYPGMGFGTGGHETTYLCLKEISSFAKEVKEWNCLDLGCGSGILGIASLKLGAKSAVFCDVDRDALDNCNHNLQLNFEVEKLSGSRIVIRERYEGKDKYELVLANILLPILKEEYKLINSSLIKGGIVILSGILESQIDETVDFYIKDNSFKKVKFEVKGDWASITLEKR